ncbi:MAG: response regulator transcription factor [Phaeodactylibacter sp.]|nr:response regulator transcription factor [Phaeodactylibacter sp.]
MAKQQHILIVEDDLHLGFLLVELLEDAGYFVKLCKDGKMGLQALQRSRYDLCILDVMMPKLDGFALAREIKTQQIDVPFLFLTARTMKQDVMAGYACGAEDYVTKPFDQDELLCKVQVILRRAQQPEAAPLSNHQYQIGAYQFDYDLQELTFEDYTTRLTEKENEILRLLCEHQNRILRRQDAVEEVYGRRDYFLGRSFDVFISRLRKILKDDPEVSIENVFKVGFILKTPEPTSAEQ